ncbi:MAG: hypothetical protein WKF78_13695 [Candidatus Limnocylindrales bacterium]
MFFYELHEGDDNVYSDVLVVSESEWEPDEFFELVQRIRRDVKDIYHQDTLSEAIARVLERDHGFVFVSDESLAAAVNVSVVEEENFLVDLEVDLPDGDDDDDDDDEDDDEQRSSQDYRSILADLDLDGDSDTPRPH